MTAIEEKSNQPVRSGKLTALWQKYNYCLLSFALTAVIVLSAYVALGLYPFGDKNILWFDLNDQYAPFFNELYDRITQGKSLLYSWNSGLGMPFFANFFNYLSSPAIIFVLALGKKYIPEAIALSVLLIDAFAAGAFTFYLGNSQKKHNLLTPGFGVLYAGCGWFIALYWNIMWITAFALLPLVILGIERIINGGKPFLYIISLGLTLLSSYYMGYMVCIFSVIWFLAYYFINHGIKEKVNNKSLFFSKCFTFAYSSLLAGGLSAVSLIPSFINLQNCSATAEGFPQKLKLYFKFADFLYASLDNVEPITQFDLKSITPNISCGILTIILVFTFFISKNFKLKEKIITLSLLAFFYLSFNINYLNYIWHAFHIPNGLPNRFSYLYCFILLLTAYKVISGFQDIKPLSIFIAITFSFALVVIVKLFASRDSTEVLPVSLAFLGVFSVLLLLLKFTNGRTSISFFVLFAIVFEVMFSTGGYYFINKDSTTYLMNYDEVCSAINTAKNRNTENDFYRMEVACDGGSNCSCIYDYYSVSGFSSMAYQKIAELEEALGCTTNNINQFYCSDSLIFDMMHAIKYRIDYKRSESYENNRYSEIGETDFNKIRENNYFLPLAFAVEKDILKWKTDTGEPEEIQSKWFKLATGLKKDKLEIEDINKGYNILKKQALNITAFDEDNIKGTIKVESDKIVYTSIPYDKGWQIKVDGKKLEKEKYHKLGNALLCFDISAGEHQLEFLFNQRGLISGTIITLITLVFIFLIYIKQKKK